MENKSIFKTKKKLFFQMQTLQFCHGNGSRQGNQQGIRVPELRHLLLPPLWARMERWPLRHYMWGVGHQDEPGPEGTRTVSLKMEIGIKKNGKKNRKRRIKNQLTHFNTHLTKQGKTMQRSDHPEMSTLQNCVRQRGWLQQNDLPMWYDPMLSVPRKRDQLQPLLPVSLFFKSIVF